MARHNPPTGALFKILGPVKNSGLQFQAQVPSSPNSARHDAQTFRSTNGHMMMSVKAEVSIIKVPAMKYRPCSR
jgi:hypothetical protein